MFYMKFIEGVFFISETPIKDSRVMINRNDADFILRTIINKTSFCRVLKDNTGHFMEGNFTKSGELSIKEVMDYVKNYYHEKK